MVVGLSPHPSDYHRYFNAVEPGKPAFCRVFSPPDHGLPSWSGHRVRSLLTRGIPPWISHKDPVPMRELAEYWLRMGKSPTPNPVRYRWTYHHEAAPLPYIERIEYLKYWSDLCRLAADFPWIEPVQIQSNYALRWRVDVDWRDWIIERVPFGMDCYPARVHTGYEPPESMFALAQVAAAEFGCPSWGVAELGAWVGEKGPVGRARWLTHCADTLAGYGAAWLGLWCTGEEFEPTDPPTLAAYHSILNR